MPEILADPPLSLKIVLGLAVLIPLVIAFFFVPPAKDKKSSPRKWYFITSGIALVLLLILMICKFVAPESDQRQILRKMREMSEGVVERNLDKTFQHVSPSFLYGSTGRDALRQQGESALQRGEVTEVPIWDVVLESITDGKNATVNFKFRVKGTFDNGVGWRGKAYFIKETDGQWRLQRFEVFHLTGDMSTPIAVPRL